MAPRSVPAVLPMGRNGTAGKTAITQNTAKAIEPKITFGVGAKAISGSFLLIFECSEFDDHGFLVEFTVTLKEEKQKTIFM